MSKDSIEQHKEEDAITPLLVSQPSRESKGISAAKIALYTALTTLPNYVAIQYFSAEEDDRTEIKLLKAADTILYNFGVTYYFGVDGIHRFLMLTTSWWSEKDKNCLGSWLKLIFGTAAVIYLSVGASAMFISCPSSFPVSSSWQQQLRDGYGWSNLITFAPMHLGGAMEALELLRDCVNAIRNYGSAFSFSSWTVWRQKERQIYVIKELDYLIKQITQKYKVDPRFRQLFASQSNLLSLQSQSDAVDQCDQLKQLMLTPLGMSLYKNKTYHYIKIITDILIEDILWMPVGLATWFVMAYTQFGYWISSVETNSVLGWDTVIINLFLMLMGAKIYLKLFFSYPQDLLLSLASGHLIKPFVYYNDKWCGNVFLGSTALVLGMGGYYSGYSAKNLINQYLYQPNGEPQLINEKIYWPKLILIGAALFNTLPNFRILFDMINHKTQVDSWFRQRITRYPNWMNVKQSASQINDSLQGVFSLVITGWNFFNFLISDILLIIPEKICLWVLHKLFTGFCILMPKASDDHPQFVSELIRLEQLSSWVQEAQKQPACISEIIETLSDSLNAYSFNHAAYTLGENKQESTMLKAAIQHGLFSELLMLPSTTQSDEKLDSTTLPIVLNQDLGTDKQNEKELILKEEVESLRILDGESQTKDFRSEIARHRLLIAEEMITLWGPFITGLALDNSYKNNFPSGLVVLGSCRLFWTMRSCILNCNFPTLRQIYRDVAPGVLGFFINRVTDFGLRQINAIQDSPEIDVIAINVGTTAAAIAAGFLKRLP